MNSQKVFFHDYKINRLYMLGGNNIDDFYF